MTSDDRPSTPFLLTVPNALGKRRSLSIDSLRGLAIVMMVAGHLIGSTDDVGMRVGAESMWRHFYELFEDMRMPLFTALSGFVYALRPLYHFHDYGSFVRGKVRRLLVPLLTVGTAFVVLQAITPGTNAGGDVRDLWRVYVYGEPGHFWFLQAIFVILLLVGLLEAAGAWQSRRRIIAAVALTGTLSIFTQLPSVVDVFSVNGALRLLPFFLLGYGLSRFGFHRSRTVQFSLLGCAAALLAVRALEVFSDHTLSGVADRTLGFLLGVAGIASLIVWRNVITVRPLARLGYYSFTIYLLHVFGTAPTRMLLQTTGAESRILIFTLCLIAGLALPVVFEITLGRVAWISRAALGQRPSPSPSAVRCSAPPRRPSMISTQPDRPV